MTGNKVYHWRVLVCDEISHLCVSQCNERAGRGRAQPSQLSQSTQHKEVARQLWENAGVLGNGHVGTLQYFPIHPEGYDSLSNILEKCLLFIFHLAAVQVRAV